MSDTREVRTIEEAIAIAEEWAVAYRALQLEHRKLQERYDDAAWWAEHHAWMRQNAHLFSKRRSPLDEPELAEADPFA